MQDLKYNREKVIAFIIKANQRLKSSKHILTTFEAIHSVFEELNQDHWNSSGTCQSIELLSHNTISGATENFEMYPELEQEKKEVIND